jgi:hypothetical protein
MVIEANLAIPPSGMFLHKLQGTPRTRAAERRVLMPEKAAGSRMEGATADEAFSSLGHGVTFPFFAALAASEAAWFTF